MITVNVSITSENRITMGQQQLIARIVEDAQRRALKVIRPDNPAAQRIVKRGNELANAIIDKMRELSVELPDIDCFSIADWQTFYNLALRNRARLSIADFPWSAAVLDSPCPFHKGKMVRETHFAMIAIGAANGEPLTISHLQALNPKATEPRFYAYRDSLLANDPFATTEGIRFGWHLLLKEIVPGSENKTFFEQKSMLPPEYEVPIAAAEAAKDVLMFKKLQHYVNPKRYARTNSVASDGTRVIVGSSAPDGLYIGSDWSGRRDPEVGIAACRKA
jgi:hypothetical protein